MPGKDYSSSLTRDNVGRLSVVVRDRDVNPICAMMIAANLRYETTPVSGARSELLFDVAVSEDVVRTILSRFAKYT
jgi:hypothetical protein